MKKLTGDYSKEKLVRVLCLVTADAVIVNLAAVVTLLIRFSIDGMTVWNSAFEWYLKLYLGYAVINTVVTIVMFALFNLYNSLWEFAGYNELVRIGCASVASALVNFVLMMVIEDSRMPLSFPIVYSMLLAAGTGTLRLIYRALRRKRSGRSTAEKKRTMLIGGGQAGAMVLREVAVEGQRAEIPVEEPQLCAQHLPVALLLVVEGLPDPLQSCHRLACETLGRVGHHIGQIRVEVAHTDFLLVFPSAFLECCVHIVDFFCCGCSSPMERNLSLFFLY